MKCSVFENEEDAPGWAAGKAVAYSEVCFEAKMEKEVVNDSQSPGSQSELIHEQFKTECSRSRERELIKCGRIKFDV